MVIENRLYAPKECIVKNGGVLAISLSGLYAAIKKGEVPVVVLGKRIMIPGRFLQGLLSGKTSVVVENNKGGIHDEIQ